MVKPNVKLIAEIRKAGLRQNSFAEKVGDHESFISRVTNGWFNLDDRRKQKYADALGVPVDELFD